MNRLYGLKINKIDWPKLTDTRRGKDKNWKALNSKDAELAGFTNSYASQFAKAFGYRNRLVHDGIIRVEVDISILGVNILLAEDWDDDTSKMNEDALNFCAQTKVDLLELLDGSYKLMLDYKASHGAPPW